MIDYAQRKMRKLRLQLLDACNFKCTYCMPEHYRFAKFNDLLSSDELFQISSKLVSQGIEEIRLTGGEPLLRPDFKEIVTKLSTLNLQKFGLTTNGFFLSQHLEFLKSTKLKFINISLDSLNENKFFYMTKSASFSKVYQAILQTKKMGFQVKINMVVMRGLNDDEILDFVNFSSKYQINVRFLELMKVGPLKDQHDQYFLPAQEIRNIISQHHSLIPILTPRDNTAQEYNTDSGAHIGIIASESEAFCTNCSRIRISATGKLRPCLFVSETLDVRTMDEVSMNSKIPEFLNLKPISRLPYVEEPMHIIGG